MTDNIIQTTLNSRINPSPARRILLSTYDNTPIPNLIDFDPTQQVIDMQNTFLKVHELRSQGAVPVGQPTGRYNCYGLVFGNRRTCIFPPDMPEGMEIESILASDLYEEVTDTTRVGDIVAYRIHGKIEHVGYIIHVEPSGSIVAVSKWGHLEEYEHPVQVTPYTGSEIEYWRLKE